MDKPNSMKFRSLDLDTRGFNLTPCQRLWLEVIYNAYHDYTHFWDSGASSHRKLRDARTARNWIFSDSTALRSFLWASEAVFDDPTHCVNFLRKECSGLLPDYTHAIDASLIAMDFS